MAYLVAPLGAVTTRFTFSTPLATEVPALDVNEKSESSANATLAHNTNNVVTSIVTERLNIFE
jgi:hypothetical protein